MSLQRPALGWLIWGLAGWALLAEPLEPGPAVSFVTVARGVRSGLHEPLQAVVRVSDEWATLWTRHAGPSAVPPPVDFSAQMVIAVFAGQRPTSGHEVEIIEVLATDQGLRVIYREHRPPAGAVVRPVLTAPFHVIRLPRSEMPVEVLQEP